MKKMERYTTSKEHVNNYKTKIMDLNLYLRIRNFIRMVYCIIVFGFVIVPSFGANAQTSSLESSTVVLASESMSVRNLLMQIKNSSDIDFVYNADAIPLDREIKFGGRKQDLASILTALDEQANLKHKAVGNQVSLSFDPADQKPVLESSSYSYAAENISGTVTESETGEPLIGVTVVVEGTSRGTVTDINGEFNLELQDGDEKIVVSYIGYKKQVVEIGNRTVIEIILESDVSALQEVIVTALAIEKPAEKIGYATQKVSGADLVKTQEPNILNNLTGKVAGLTVLNSPDFFSTSSFSLRGERPLIVIDGVPNTSTNLWELNSNDVESIDVLKGAPASALYGSLGRNGAIMITTKRGTKQDGLQVELSSNTMVQFDFLRIPQTQSQYGSGRFGQYRYIDGTGSGTEGSGFSWGPRLDVPDPTTPSGFVELVQFNSPRDPITGELTPLPWISRGANNMDNFFENGVISNNTIAVTAGDARRNIRVSASHKYQKGIVPNTDLGSSNLSVAGRYTHKRLTVDASLNYNRQESDNIPEVAFSSQSFIYNIALWMGANVDVNDLRDYWIDGREGFQQRHYSTSFYNNPHFLVNEFNR